jgi:hypothetical protein
MELTNARTLHDFSDTITNGRVVGTVESINTDVVKIMGSIFYGERKIEFQMFPMNENVGCSIQGANSADLITIIDIVKTEISIIKQQLSN